MHVKLSFTNYSVSSNRTAEILKLLTVFGGIDIEYVKIIFKKYRKMRS